MKTFSTWVMALALATAAAARDWRDAQGRVLAGEMEGLMKGCAQVRLADGRRLLLKAEQLSEADRDWVRAWREERSAKEALAPLVWPKQVKHPPVKVMQAEPTGNGTVFRSGHFEFHSDSAVSAGIMNDFATVAEATLRLVDALPLTFPERAQGRLQARIFGSRDAFIRAGGQKDAAGMYLGGMPGRGGVLIVPMSSLGAQVFAGRFTKGYGYDAQVLVHEIAHQAMGEAIPFIPHWLSEGLAEYVACMPYHDGAFQVTAQDIAAGLRARLAKVREIGRERDVFDRDKKSAPGPVLVPLAELVKAGPEGWDGPLSRKHRCYFTAQLLTTYLLHLDGDRQAAGLRLAMDEASAARTFLLTRGKRGSWPVDLSQTHELDFGVVPARVDELVLSGRSWERLEAQMLAACEREWGLAP